MYENNMEPGFAGMKADSGDDRVESFPVGAAGVPCGAVCGTNAGGLLVAGAGAKIRGIAVHSHAIMCGKAKYEEGDCASVMTRGLIWALVKNGGVVTKDGAVKFDADGTVHDAGATALPNAVFRGESKTGNGQTVAVVELHNPLV